MNANKERIADGMPPHPLMTYQGIINFQFFEFCESPTVLEVVKAGFAKSYRLHEGIRFILIATKKDNKFLKKRKILTSSKCKAALL